MCIPVPLLGDLCDDPRQSISVLIGEYRFMFIIARLVVFVVLAIGVVLADFLIGCVFGSRITCLSQALCL